MGNETLPLALLQFYFTVVEPAPPVYFEPSEWGSPDPSAYASFEDDTD